MASSTAEPKGWGVIRPADTALRSNNPIRKIVEALKKPEAPTKPFMSLALGDPTVFGNLRPPHTLVRTAAAYVSDGAHDGYIHSAGTVEARRAVAAYSSVAGQPPLTEDDIVIASGCSGALDLAITVLLNPGDNLLVPKPAFALYQTLAESKGVAVKHYHLLPERQWEADISHLESLIDEKTRAILVNNPSNPCGSVYSKEHLLQIIAIAEKHRIPIIADEIYGNLVFSGSEFHPMASLSENVPILSTSGIAKEFLVPGWRVGWVVVHDRHGAFAEIRKGLFALSQLILGANAPIVHSLPAILTPAAGSEDEASLADFRRDTIAQLEEHARFTTERLSKIPGLEVIVPQGAMYVLFGVCPAEFEDIPDDVAFSRMLLAEQNLVVLPGSAFNMAMFIRVVFCAPKDKLADAFDRMAEFCEAHRKKSA